MKDISTAPSHTDIRTEMFAQRRQRSLFEQAKRYAFEYLDTLNDRPVFPTESAIAALEAFEEPLPSESQPPADILQLLHDIGTPAAVSHTGGRYFGFVCGSTTPVAIASKWMADVWDQCPALFVMSPILAKLESVCQSWLKDLFGLPEKTVAGFVSGTSMATLCGLAAGRHALLQQAGWDVNDSGLMGAPRIRVILGEQAHGTVFKALALLGLGTQQVERIPVEANGTMDISQLPQLDADCLIIAQAGNVNSGGFDPISEICERASAAGAWVHVDGAFGLWAAGSRKTRHLIKGIEKADSWSVDAHKTLNAPYDCGIVLCRHPEHLVAAMQLSGDYIQYSQRRDSMMYTPEMSRRSRALELWATLKYLGKRGIESLVDGLCARALQFADQLAVEGFRIVNDVVFNQVLVTCDSAEETVATMNHLQASGECWCGGSTYFDEPVIRLSICSWATTPDDVDRSVAAFVKCRSRARSQMQAKLI